MALRFLEGFEVDGGNPTQLSRKYDVAAGVSATTGRLHGTSGQLNTTSGRLRTRSLGSPTGTCIIGFAFQSTESGSASEGMKVVILNGASEQIRMETVEVTSTTFRWDIYRGATLLASSSSFSTLNWHYFELEVVVDTSVGSYELRRNETLDISDAGVNTADSGSANWDTVDFQNFNGSDAVRLDDVYICDSTGTLNNDFLGDSVVEGRLPTGDGATTDWTPSTGAVHWDLLDDTTDATNVTSNNAGDIDYLTFDSLSFITGTVHGAMACMSVALDALGTRTVRLKALSGASTGDGSSQVVESTDYAILFDVFETDPNTSSAWAISDLNNASFGFELVS